MYIFFFFFSTQFLCQAIYTQRTPKRTQVIVGSMNMGYISDTARNRTHNLFRPKREPIPLGHSDGYFKACAGWLWPYENVHESGKGRRMVEVTVVEVRGSGP